MNKSVNSPSLEAAKTYALDQLRYRLSPTLCYHTLWHTKDEVVPRVRWLAHQESVGQDATLLACTAAYFHDIGFIERTKEHEVASSAIAAQILPTCGYTTEQIRIVQGIIMATQLPQSPHNLLEQIVADADLDVLGRTDFQRRNEALRAEMAASGVVCSDAAWYREQIRFLSAHRYFTLTAQRERDRGKQMNFAAIQKCIDADRSRPVQAAVLATAPNLTIS